MSPMSRQVVIRPATPSDCETIYHLCYELMDYENEAPHKRETPASNFTSSLFTPDGQPTIARVFLATLPPCEEKGEKEKVLGMTLSYPSFAATSGGYTLYMRLLYVREEYRSLGVGQKLVRNLAQLCKEMGYVGLEWVAYSWNEKAIRFYEKLGGKKTEAPLVFFSAYGNNVDGLLEDQ
ncbi:uncharacterized protein VTP21DRAFT_9464 [Calcarisporiella thermophila]|uniref:uncharacterized protein n=1 Tax=Calcarisporiella thermophila TaxID=911321 RepID=UPI003742938F